MLFALRFTDDQQKRAVRERYRADHLAWLAARTDRILVAGSLREQLDANPAGALWIVAAGSMEEARGIFATDPFWVNGLRQGVEVFHWVKAFPDKDVLV